MPLILKKLGSTTDYNNSVELPWSEELVEYFISMGVPPTSVGLKTMIFEVADPWKIKRAIANKTAL